MNIKSLRAFRATLSEGSLARAAEILHLSQPAVSRLISSLEEEFSRIQRDSTQFEMGERALLALVDLGNREGWTADAELAS